MPPFVGSRTNSGLWAIQGPSLIRSRALSRSAMSSKRIWGLEKTGHDGFGAPLSVRPTASIDRFRAPRVNHTSELAFITRFFGSPSLVLYSGGACGAGATEASGKKSLDQLQRERGPDHFSAQAKDVHVVILDALMGGEDVMDEAGTHAGDFVSGDGRSHAAAAEATPRSTSPAEMAHAMGMMKSG